MEIRIISFFGAIDVIPFKLMGGGYGFYPNR